MALWGGRFEAGVAEVTQEFGASLPVDKHLYKQDIAGSKAHAKMLAAQGIISAEDEQAIAEGLTGIEQDIDAGNFTFDINDEDIHMSIESADASYRRGWQALAYWAFAQRPGGDRYTPGRQGAGQGAHGGQS